MLAATLLRPRIHTRLHDSSMRLVAEGLADIAAIDSISWRMSRAVDPRTVGLKSIGTTEPTLGLPFIVAKGKFDDGLFDAVRAGIAALPDNIRPTYRLRDIVPLRRNDYEVIRTNLIEAEAAHSLPKMEEMAPTRPL